MFIGWQFTFDILHNIMFSSLEYQFVKHHPINNKTQYIIQYNITIIINDVKNIFPSYSTLPKSIYTNLFCRPYYQYNTCHFYFSTNLNFYF